MVRHDVKRYTQYPRYYLVRAYEAFNYGLWERGMDCNAIELDSQAQNLTFIGIHKIPKAKEEVKP